MKRRVGIVCDCIKGEDQFITLERIKKAGFDCIGIDSATSQDTEKVKKLGEKAKELGLWVDFVHSPFANINSMWLDSEDHVEVMEKIKTAIISAKLSNCKNVVVHISSGWNSPEICDIGLQRFDALVDFAKENGVKIAFENLRKVGNVAYFADRYANNDSVGFCYDSGHEFGYTETVTFADIFKHRITCTHIHDNFGKIDPYKDDPDLHHVPFDGKMDYKKMMKNLKKYSYSGALTLEVWNTRHKHMTPDAFLKMCYKRITKISKM